MSQRSRTPASPLSNIPMRNAWKSDLSVMVVETQDGQPYCLVPNHNASLSRFTNHCSFISSLGARLAKFGNNSGSTALAVRDFVQKLKGSGLVLSRLLGIISRSRLIDFLYRHAVIFQRDTAFHKLKDHLRPKLDNICSGGIWPTCFHQDRLDIDFKTWLFCIVSWVVYFARNPTQDKLFGKETMTSEEEIKEASKALEKAFQSDFATTRPTSVSAPGEVAINFEALTARAEASEGETRPEFDANIVANVLGISKLAAVCLWTIAKVACQQALHEIDPNVREGVLMKYTLGKLLLFTNGTLYDITREFGRDIAHGVYKTRQSDQPRCDDQTFFRHEYYQRKKQKICELAPSDASEQECAYLLRAINLNEEPRPGLPSDQPSVLHTRDSRVFQKFVSLATLVAFQIDVAEVRVIPSTEMLANPGALENRTVSDASQQSLSPPRSRTEENTAISVQSIVDNDASNTSNGFAVTGATASHVQTPDRNEAGTITSEAVTSSAEASLRTATLAPNQEQNDALPPRNFDVVLLNRGCRNFGKPENAMVEMYRSTLRKGQITANSMIFGVSKVSTILVWILFLGSIAGGIIAAILTGKTVVSKIEAFITISGPFILLLGMAEYLSFHDKFVKALLTSKLEINKLSALSRFLGLSYNEALWLVASDHRASNILHKHGSSFLRKKGTGPLTLDRISRPRETMGEDSIWGIKYVVDPCGVRKLSGNSDGTLRISNEIENMEENLIIISLEGSQQIR